MIDIENQLFDLLTNKITSEFPEATVGNVNLENVPARFPFVYIEEVDSYSPRRLRDSSDKPKYARVAYKVEIYSNREYGKKSECKKIGNYINDVMEELNFTRDGKHQDDNMTDRRLFRLVLTFTANTDGKYIYRR